MQFSTMIDTVAQARGESAALEALGFDALFTNETKHDPFVLSSLVAQNTKKVEIMTYIAVAFARTPMLTAYSAHDLNALSGGRFTLGLGSQIKAHITRRFSMPWSHPAPRMKEYIRALHAIWDCWYEGKPLAFEGQFYTHTLTSPMFIPEDREVGRPRVSLAAVGPAMTRVAAEAADDLLCHSFSTPRYLREATLPLVEDVLKANGRARENFRIICIPFIATGRNEEEIEQAIVGRKRSLAFYASTPAYKAVLDFHGWGDLQPEMLRLSKLGKWEEMGARIPDEVFDAFCVHGAPKHCARELLLRYRGIADMCCGYAEAGLAALPTEIVAEMKKLQAPAPPDSALPTHKGN
jgi:probable F420-dependent oxidoreductase